ncbi:unnamed protein product [Rotaria socialis]
MMQFYYISYRLFMIVSNSCSGYLDDSGVWNNGFSCQPINNRVRVCCGPENRRECCFADELPHRSNSYIDSDNLSSNKSLSPFDITSSPYTYILIAIGLTLILLIVLLITFIYIIRRKLNGSSSSSSSSCSSDTSSMNKQCRRLSLTVATSSSKSSTSSPVPSTYVDYWSRTIVSPSEWTLTKPYNSFTGGPHSSNNLNYYIDYGNN